MLDRHWSVVAYSYNGLDGGKHEDYGADAHKGCGYGAERQAGRPMPAKIDNLRPLIGAPNTGYGQQEWVAALIVVALVLLVLCIRRFSAAREAKWAIGPAVLYAVNPWQRTPPGGQTVSSHGLLVGTDNRTSTSKTTAALWTVMLVYFIIVMALVLGFDEAEFNALIGSTSPLYLVLLGGPFAAAVIAKATVNSAVTDQSLQRSVATSPSVADVFSDDDGNTDLVDLQYITFNVVVAAIVLVQFLHAPALGAPNIPDFLAGLTSASAATYVTNKVLVTGSGNTPSISDFAPSSARPGAQVTMYGSNFIAAGESDPPTVLVNGGGAIHPSEQPPLPDKATFRLSPALTYGPATVTIMTPAGVDATSQALTIVQDSLVVAMAEPTTAGPNTSLDLYGSGFFDALDVDASGSPLAGTQPAIVTLTARSPDAQPHQCVPVAGHCSDSILRVTVPPDILTRSNEQPGWFDVFVQRGGLQARPNIAIQIS